MTRRIVQIVAAVSCALGPSACSRAQAAADNGAQLILADVANETGDALFDRSILTLASVGLRQSPFVRLFPRSRVPAIYALMRIGNPDTALTFDLAQEVAERAGVRWVLGLSVSARGDRYIVHSRLADVGRHRQLPPDSTALEGRSTVIAALDGLLTRVRRSLGESSRDLTAHAAPLPLVTTGSIEALHSFADGSRAWSRGDYPQARELWERAVNLDTGFAMALGALGAFHYYTHDRDRGERYYRDAFARATRLTERELLELRIGRARFRGILDSAVDLSRVVAERFPSGNTWGTLAAILMTAGRDEEAITAFERSLALDSLNVDTWINVATAEIKLGRAEKAVESYRHAGRIDSTRLYLNNINHEYGGALVAAGRHEEAESVYRRMAAAPRLEDRALGLRSLALLAFWRGNSNDAIAYFRQAIDAAAQLHSALSEARNHMSLATVYHAANRRAEANHEIDRALALTAAPTFAPTLLSVLVYQCEQLDRKRDAASVATLVRTRALSDAAADQAAVAFAEAALALGLRRPDSALVIVGRTASFPWPVLRLALTADALRAAGRLDSARAVITAMIGRQGFGSEGQAEWLHAPIVLGDLLLAAGDTAGAIQRYRVVKEQWREVPPDWPDLVSAQARLKTLSLSR